MSTIEAGRDQPAAGSKHLLAFVGVRKLQACEHVYACKTNCVRLYPACPNSDEGSVKGARTAHVGNCAVSSECAYV
jgi:hypothetical protein